MFGKFVVNITHIA